MDEELMKEAKEALSHVRGMKEKFDQGVITSAQFKEAVEKTDAVLEKQEKANQEALAKLSSAQNELNEVKERADKLEKHLLTMGKGEVKNLKDSQEYKAFNEFLTSGKTDQIDMFTKEINRSDIMTAGGALMWTDMFNEIIKNVTETSPIRTMASVTQINAKSIDLMIRKTLLAATGGIGETQAVGTSNSTYGVETFTPYRMGVKVPVTQDQIMNSMINFEGEIMSDVVESFSQQEGNWFINGDGDKKAEGILVNAEVIAGALTSSGSGTIDFDDLILLSGRLKKGYNGVYSFNRTTNAFLRTLKGTDGHYLWQMQSAGMNTLNGFNYVIDAEMPDVVAGAIPVLFADFRKGYRIVDRTAIMTIRDEITQADQSIVNLTFQRWLTGKVQQSEAIKALKVKA